MTHTAGEEEGPAVGADEEHDGERFVHHVVVLVLVSQMSDTCQAVGSRVLIV